MSPLLMLVAILGSILVSRVVCPLLTYVPAILVPGWEEALPSREAALASAAPVLLFVTGLAAGWLSQARSRWGAIGAGALAGWLSAWVAESLCGGIAAGLWGARSLIAHGPVPAESETAFHHLLAESVLGTVLAVHVSTALSGIAGAVIGGLGGVLGSLMTRPSAPDAAFSLRLSGAMLLVSGLHLWIIIVVFATIAQLTQNLVESASFVLSSPTEWMFSAPVAIVLVWWLFWAAMSWISLRQMSAGERCGLFQSLAFVVGGWVTGLALTPMSGVLIPGVMQSMQGLPHVSSLLCWAFLAVPLLLGIGWLVVRFFPKRARDFLKHQGEQCLIACYLLVVTLLTFLLSLIAAPDKCWRNPWLTAGLLIGVLLALDAVRRARPAVPVTGEPALNILRLSGTALSVHFLTNLTLSLTMLAPLALVMLPVTFIPYVQPGDFPARATSSSAEIARAYLTVATVVGRRILFNWTLAATIMSILLWALWVVGSRLLAKYKTYPGRP